VLLAWPEFFIEGSWIGFEELYEPLDALAKRNRTGFTNATGETLFEAVSRTAVDWRGQTRTCAPGSSCDLSPFVVADDGIFLNLTPTRLALAHLDTWKNRHSSQEQEDVPVRPQSKAITTIPFPLDRFTVLRLLILDESHRLRKPPLSSSASTSAATDTTTTTAPS
jgi:hypothetical protein